MSFIEKENLLELELSCMLIETNTPHNNSQGQAESDYQL